MVQIQGQDFGRKIEATVVGMAVDQTLATVNDDKLVEKEAGHQTAAAEHVVGRMIGLAKGLEQGGDLAADLAAGYDLLQSRCDAFGFDLPWFLSFLSLPLGIEKVFTKLRTQHNSKGADGKVMK